MTFLKLNESVACLNSIKERERELCPQLSQLVLIDAGLLLQKRRLPLVRVRDKRSTSLSAVRLQRRGIQRGGGTICIPMVETYVRCLNLSVSVGVAVYEASRQLNYEQIECAPEGDSVNGEEPLFADDIFA